MNNKFLNAIIIVCGTAIASFATELRGLYSDQLINVFITLGVLIIVFGLNNIFKYDDYITKLFNAPTVKKEKTIIINCPECKKRCRVPIDKTLDIKCPHCTHKWMEIT
jgi:hypothetical protein